jgi:hypothetical protein
VRAQVRRMELGERGALSAEPLAAA